VTSLGEKSEEVKLGHLHLRKGRLIPGATLNHQEEITNYIVACVWLTDTMRMIDTCVKYLVGMCKYLFCSTVQNSVNSC
jgi:hypothetical protein